MNQIALNVSQGRRITKILWNYEMLQTYDMLYTYDML
jgi:hypothetical protein